MRSRHGATELARHRATQSDPGRHRGAWGEGTQPSSLPKIYICNLRDHKSGRELRPQALGVRVRVCIQSDRFTQGRSASPLPPPPPPPPQQQRQPSSGSSRPRKRRSDAAIHHRASRDVSLCISELHEAGSRALSRTLAPCLPSHG